MTNKNALPVSVTICIILTLAITPSLYSQQAPLLGSRDLAVIGEAYNLRTSLADSAWFGWGKGDMPIVYIKGDWEYAIAFPTSLNDAADSAFYPEIGRSVQVRPRTLSPHLAAAFGFEGVNSVVIGTPESLEWDPNRWVIKANHEMFHVYQYRSGHLEKVQALKIGPDNNPSWHLDYPFPYDDDAVMAAAHLIGYNLYLTATTQDTADARYQAGTALDAIKVFESLLQRDSTGEKDYNYARFQQSGEGISQYAELALTRAIREYGYTATSAFAALDDAQSWDDFAESYEGTIYLVKHAGRAAKNRLVFYHLGLGMGLALDRMMPEWKGRYFESEIWLDDLLAEAVETGQACAVE